MTGRRKPGKRQLVTAHTTAVEDLGLGLRGPPAAETVPPPRGLWVRTTCHIPWGGDRGTIHYVDPDEPQVARALEHLRMVPLPGQDWNYNQEEEKP